MKIESEQLAPTGKPGQSETQVVMLRVTGTVDTTNHIVRAARALIESRASLRALASFDTAVAEGLLRADR